MPKNFKFLLATPIPPPHQRLAAETPLQKALLSALFRDLLFHLLSGLLFDLLIDLLWHLLSDLVCRASGVLRMSWIMRKLPNLHETSPAQTAGFPNPKKSERTDPVIKTLEKNRAQTHSREESPRPR